MHKNRKNETGAAILMMALILMLAAALVIVFAAAYSTLQQKTVTNQQSNNKAFAAAEAGLDYAMAYLLANSAAIIATASSGHITYNIASTTQADNSTYSAVITNPTINSYTLLLITSTGTSPDTTSQHVISQQVYASGSSVQYAMTTQSSLTSSGNTTITGPKGVDTGGAVTQSGNSNISTVTQNDNSVASMTPAQFFSSVFGQSMAAQQASSAYYASSAGVPWSSLSGPVWINSSVALSSPVTIGTAANPVILIVNGSFVVSGQVTVNGLIYTMNGITASGQFNINGGVLSQGAIVTSGNTTINYNSTILNKLSVGGGSTYAKLPGSWVDF